MMFVLALLLWGASGPTLITHYARLSAPDPLLSVDHAWMVAYLASLLFLGGCAGVAVSLGRRP